MTSRELFLPLPEEQTKADAAPRDAYGPGYFVFSLASDFHALCCLIGAEAARQEVAEIINAEFARKRQ